MNLSPDGRRLALCLDGGPLVVREDDGTVRQISINRCISPGWWIDELGKAWLQAVCQFDPDGDRWDYSRFDPDTLLPYRGFRLLEVPLDRIGHIALCGWREWGIWRAGAPSTLTSFGDIPGALCACDPVTGAMVTTNLSNTRIEVYERGGLIDEGDLMPSRTVDVIGGLIDPAATVKLTDGCLVWIDAQGWHAQGVGDDNLLVDLPLPARAEAVNKILVVGD